MYFITLTFNLYVCLISSCSSAKQNDKKPPVKEELKVLSLTNHSQELIMDTLIQIHGPVSTYTT